MSAIDDTVSPYLLLPLRSYKEAMRDRTARIPYKVGSHGTGGADSRKPTRPETDDVERAQ